MGKNNSIDWLNHGLEFLVVVIGILLAFQLNTCSSNRSQQKTVEIHLEQIEKETLFNKQSIESSIAYTKGNNLKLDTILNLIDKKENSLKINYLALSLLNMGGAYIRKNAYLTLTESADIRFMKSFDQKQDIVNLYEFYKWVEGFDELSRSLFSDDFYPYLKDNFDLVNGRLQDETVYNNKLFRNILGAYQRTNQNRLVKYSECLETINKYLGIEASPDEKEKSKAQ